MTTQISSTALVNMLVEMKQTWESWGRRNVSSPVTFHNDHWSLNTLTAVLIIDFLCDAIETLDPGYHVALPESSPSDTFLVLPMTVADYIDTVVPQQIETLVVLRHYSLMVGLLDDYMLVELDGMIAELEAYRQMLDARIHRIELPTDYGNPGLRDKIAADQAAWITEEAPVLDLETAEFYEIERQRIDRRTDPAYQAELRAFVDAYRADDAPYGEPAIPF